jgi:DNA-directed RNA polymerase subunit RPC12/RpoP
MAKTFSLYPPSKCQNCGHDRWFKVWDNKKKGSEAPMIRKKKFQCQACLFEVLVSDDARK